MSCTSSSIGITQHSFMIRLPVRPIGDIDQCSQSRNVSHDHDYSAPAHAVPVKTTQSP